MNTYQKDVILVLRMESIILPQIRTYFKRKDIKKTEDKYAIFDFYDCEYKYELKSRNNKYQQFPTTLIGCNKLAPKTIYLFNFTNGLYFLEYNEELFNTFEKKPFKRHPREGKIDYEREYIFIPIEHLTKIN
jgi:hypothetical protein